MNQRYDRLDICIIRRPPELNAEGDGKHERHTVDFLVNGQSLYEMMAVHKLDLVGRFWRGAQTWNEDSAEIFLTSKPADLEHGRTMLYICPECGDIGCGAITVKIGQSQDGYTWADFGYENNYEAEMRELDRYRGIGPFKFKADEYREAIEKAKAA